MVESDSFEQFYSRYIMPNNHAKSDYFGLIEKLIELSSLSGENTQQHIDSIYALVLDEILTNDNPPHTQLKFGTSGWRGILGKDLTVHTVSCVTSAIIELYINIDDHDELKPLLGVASCEEARERGCVVGFDNRFGGEILACAVVAILTKNGFQVHYAGESTTGVLSAALLQLGAAFSINLTPSHNPMQYGGFKYNAADGGPAQAQLTSKITQNGRRIIDASKPEIVSRSDNNTTLSTSNVKIFDSLKAWKTMVRSSFAIHGIDYDAVIDGFNGNSDMVVVIDSVHGASRLHIQSIFKNSGPQRLIHLRGEPDVTFGGIAPEPSSENMQGVVEALSNRGERLKLGAIIDPDGDRIRFTDGSTEISMNQFGAMAYHFIHEIKNKKGLVAKTVATSNLANRIAHVMGEEVFEPMVGFKEFKPVMGKALVFFEESDGISIIGHTPEKDAYIGLLLALDMMLSLNKNLGEYLEDIEKEYGAYYPDRDGIEVSLKGHKLNQALSQLEKYSVGSTVTIGEDKKTIKEVITIDGYKIIFEDGSWLMIRPSGTEPKVRFYVESRSKTGTDNLVNAAKAMLEESGII